MLQSYKQYFKLEYIFLFLVAFEFLNKTNYIILLFFLYLLFRYGFNSKVLSNTYFPCIAIFSVSYFIFGGNTISFSDPFVWMASYYIGIIICSKKKNIPYTALFVIIGIASALNGALIYINFNQVVEFGARVTYNLWGEIRAGTSSACLFLIYSGVLYSLLCNDNIKKWIKIILILTIPFIPLNAILISSRSALLYPFIIFVISYFVTINKKNISTRIMFLLILLIIFTTMYFTNFCGIKTYFESTFLYERLETKHDGGIVNNSRFGIWENRLNMIISNFWGGGIQSHGSNVFMHNIVLDTIAYGGFPTAVILVVFMLHNINNVIYVFKRTISPSEKSCLIGVTTSFYIIFMFEPIIQAANWFFCLYIFFAAVIDRQKRNIKLHRYNNQIQN